MNLVKQRGRILFCVFSVLGFVPSAMGDESASGWIFSSNPQGQEKSTPQANSNYQSRSPFAFQDDLTPDESMDFKLTPEQKHEALVWNITDEQEKRYILLMQGRSGFYYKNNPELSPLDILAVNARTDSERAYYASMVAMDDTNRKAKELAYASATSHAVDLIRQKYNMSVIKPFDYSKFSPYSYEPVDLKPGDEVALFLKIGDAVKPIVVSMMGLVNKNPGTKFSVWFEGHPTQADIFNWAKSQNIPSEMVQSGRITLNVDSGKKGSAAGKTPLVFLNRAGKSTQLNPGEF